jgi:pyruvate dehydrogenase complex dehydrogenase (E1) component
LGRSDTREALRPYIEIDEAHVVDSGLCALSTSGEIDADAAAKAISEYGIDVSSRPVD